MNNDQFRRAQSAYDNQSPEEQSDRDFAIDSLAESIGSDQEEMWNLLVQEMEGPSVSTQSFLVDLLDYMWRNFTRLQDAEFSNSHLSNLSALMESLSTNEAVRRIEASELP